MAELAKRQRTRRVILAVSFLLFPVTIFYFSPYLIVGGAFLGILSGSAVVFAALFVSSLIFGRAFCGWVCPAGGMQSLLIPIQGRRVGRAARYVKYAVWVPWVATIVFGAIRAGGISSIDMTLGTEGGLSVASVHGLLIYLVVVGLLAGLALGFGRRAGCHTICWMAPFMVLGRKLRNAAGWPSLQLAVNSENCIQCSLCTRECPMSLPVMEMVDRLRDGAMDDAECILCGACVDRCPRDVIAFQFRGRHNAGHSAAAIVSE